MSECSVSFAEFSRKLERLKVLRTMKAGLFRFSVLFLEDFMVSWNGIFAVCVPFRSGISGAVDGTLLTDLSSTLSGEEVNISTVSDRLIVSVDDLVKAELLFVPFDSSQVRKLLSMRTNWKNLPDLFKEGLDMSLHVISKDLTSGFLYNLLIDDSRMVSSDNYRVLVFEMGRTLGAKFMLLRDVVSLLSKFDGFQSFSVLGEDNWVVFLLEDETRLFCRLSKGTYPEVDSFFDFEGHWVKVFPGIREGVTISSLFARRNFPAQEKIRVSVKGKQFTCEGKGQDGSVFYQCEVKGNKRQFSFLADPEVLDVLLEKSARMYVGADRLILAGDNFRCLILLEVENE